MEISDDEIKESLFRSGYLIENRIIKWLNENNYFVEPNSTFYDTLTGKSREIDIIADNFGVRDVKELDIGLKTVLLIEIKNNPVPVIFFKGISDKQYELYSLMRYVSDSKYNIDDFMDKIDYSFYHYFDNSMSTQYCSFERKKVNDKWMAIHPVNLYEAFKKLQYISDLMIANYENFPNKKRYNRFFRYQPVLILSDYLYEAEILNNELIINKKDIISYGFNYSTEKDQKTIIIDVIVEKYMPQYSEMIKREDALTYKEIVNILKVYI